jgi:hypothetical protein
MSDPDFRTMSEDDFLSSLGLNPDFTIKPKPELKGDPNKWTYQRIIKEWVYVRNAKRFVCLTNFEHKWDKAGFDDAFAEIPRGAFPRLSKLLLEHKNSRKAIRKVDDMVYRPGEYRFVGDGRKLNLYSDTGVKPKAGGTLLWNAHLNYLFPDAKTRTHVLNWLAWMLQNKGLKPKHALLIAGKVQGTGKSFISEVMMRLLGKGNFATLTEDDIDSSFNEWAERSKLIVIEELQALDRGAVKKRLHHLITQEALRLNDKNEKRYQIENCFGIIANTNHEAAIKLENDERRWLVVRTMSKPKPAAYYDKLYGLLADDKALAAIYAELLARDCGGYNGQGRAPMTDDKADMVEAGHSDLESWLHHEKGNAPFTWPLISIHDDIVPIIPRRYSKQGGLVLAIAEFLQNSLHGQRFVDQHWLPKAKRQVRLWAINGSAAETAQLEMPERARLYERTREASKNAEAANEFGA